MNSIQHKRHKQNLTAKKYFLIFFFFFFSYNLRIIQEYFQPKIRRKIRIFSLGPKNNIFMKKKSVSESISVSLSSILGNPRVDNRMVEKFNGQTATK